MTNTFSSFDKITRSPEELQTILENAAFSPTALHLENLREELADHYDRQIKELRKLNESAKQQIVELKNSVDLSNQQLEQAKRDSKNSKRLSLIAIFIAAFAVVISLVCGFTDIDELVTSTLSLAQYFQ